MRGQAPDAAARRPTVRRGCEAPRHGEREGACSCYSIQQVQETVSTVLAGQFWLYHCNYIRVVGSFRFISGCPGHCNPLSVLVQVGPASGRGSGMAAGATGPGAQLEARGVGRSS